MTTPQDDILRTQFLHEQKQTGVWDLTKREMSEIDSGGILKPCRKCGVLFSPKNWQIKDYDYECVTCKRARQNALNYNDKNFRLKRRIHNSKPKIKEYRATYTQMRKENDPGYKLMRCAHRKVGTEIEASRLFRLPCEICGIEKADAHHHDYSRPLDVKWLCRRHHAQSHAMIRAGKGEK